jgi:hypothetical protein
MPLSLENANCPGDAENLHQYNAKPHTREIDSIILSPRNSHTLPAHGPPRDSEDFSKSIVSCCERTNLMKENENGKDS